MTHANFHRVINFLYRLTLWGPRIARMRGCEFHFYQFGSQGKRSRIVKAKSFPYLEPRGMMFSMGPRETNPNFMNGVPELLILRLLAKQEMYGYEIVQAIRNQTDSIIAVGEGVVYPVLHGLERDGALKSHRKMVNGRSRVYYTVTVSGSLRLAELSKTWASLAGAIHKMLAGGHYGKAV